MKLTFPKCKADITGSVELMLLIKLLMISERVPWDALFYTDLSADETESLEEFVDLLKELKRL